MDQLVQRLAQGDHPISARRSPSISDLQHAIERGYVLVTFTATQGGTEVGLRLDRDRCNLTRANFAQGIGVIHLVGDLTLNYVKVCGSVDIDLATLDGSGHLEIIEG